MEQDAVFKIIQKYLSEIPVILIGTGGTIPHGLPSMASLAKFLIEELDAKYKTDDKWERFADNLRMKLDLESALTGLEISPGLLADITDCTWRLISEKDLALFKRMVCLGERLPLGRLIAHFLRPHPQCVSIITTNYDRVVEYACDQIKVRQANLFEGRYIGELSSDVIDTKNIVNILKVHGSLDWFEDDNSKLHSFPQQNFIWDGYVPKIIPPGSVKYQSAFQQPYRTVIHQADEQINKAKSFLCIGYGFNDEHIQAQIISTIARGIPIVVVTKSITDKAASLLCNNASKSIIIQEDPKEQGYTEFIVNKKYVSFPGNHWSVDGLLEIIT